MMAHRLPIAGHPARPHKHDTIRRTFYRPHLAPEVDHIVRKYRTCAWNNPMYHHRRYLQLLLASVHCKFVAMDAAENLPKMVQSSQYIFVIADRNFKLTPAVPTLQRTAAHVSNLFMAHWLIPNSTPSYLLNDNDTQILSKLFAIVCALHGVQPLTITPYHPQPNGQIERIIEMIFTRLWHYVAEHPRDWDTFVQLLTYNCETQIHRSTNQLPFILVLS